MYLAPAGTWPGGRQGWAPGWRGTGAAWAGGPAQGRTRSRAAAGASADPLSWGNSGTE